jgi:hypothetical protein
MADTFGGKWESRLPGVESGSTDKFSDQRVHWALDKIGGVTNKSVLEIGPFEGFHSFAFHKGEALSVLSIESNRDNFLKCLVVKEMYDLNSVKFVVGDAQAYLKDANNSSRFDVAWASGVLYHLQEPVDFLERLLDACDAVYIWTHFFSNEINLIRNGQEKHFVPSADHLVNSNGHQIRLHARSYLIPEYDSSDAGLWQGGIKDLTYWMEKQDILRTVKDKGFEISALGKDSEVNGLPCFDFVAVRNR